MFRDMTFIDSADALADAGANIAMDEDTFRAIYDQNARGLWAYLARVTGDRQLADDLLQETFYHFLRAAAPHDSAAHLRNSLYRIATNLARDARRRHLIRAPFSEPSSHIEHASNDQRGDAESSADFTDAMSRLKPRERAMLWLAYAEGASHREIAEVLGLTPGSLKPMLFRARRRLAALLGREPKEQS
jgi:RNA polymerase sigma-70 factor (ECF subfamily)